MTRYFVGVGAQKAGTSWLHAQLARHPEVCLAANKEVHYFDMVYPTRHGESFGLKRLNRLRRIMQHSRAPGGQRAEKQAEIAAQILDSLELNFTKADGYRAVLSAHVSPLTRIVGEITPSYSTLSDEGFLAMRETLNDPRVIFVMRDPVERCWSQIRMGHPDPERAVAEFAQAANRSGVLARSDFRATVRALDDTFSNVLYLFYESMFNEQTLSRIARFLGVNPLWDWRLDLKVRVGSSVSMPAPSAELMQALRPTYAFVRDRFGDEVPDRWRYDLLLEGPS